MQTYTGRHRESTATIIPYDNATFACGYGQNACRKESEIFPLIIEAPVDVYTLPNATVTDQLITSAARFARASVLLGVTLGAGSLIVFTFLYYELRWDEN